MTTMTDSISCQVETTWEWAQTGTTPTETNYQTVRKSVTISQNWQWYEVYGEWAQYGSQGVDPSGGSNLVVNSYPSQPSGSGSYAGEIRTTYGSGSAEFTEPITTGGDPIYGWVSIGSSHNHPSSITYNDEDYTGTLYFDYCDGTTAPSPSHSGSYVGDQTQTTYSATAYYFGEVTLKPDTTPPTISTTGHDGLNSITVYWTANDNRSLRETDTFALYISGPDNTTLKFKQYVGKTETSFTFTSDGDGLSLKPNSIYLVRVVAVDANNNTAYAERYVTFKTSRPANFSWDNPKASGSDFNLTADEWNKFIDTINEFRVYKGYTAINTFLYGSVGANFTADHFNKSINGINSMSPPTSPPGSATIGDDVFAYQLNNIVTSLNSLT